MTPGYSREDFMMFFNYLANKGLMKKSTVSARKASSKAILSVLDDDEASDLRTINFEDVINRFSNLEGSNFKPRSLQVYKSRLSIALNDFLNYKKDPLSFKPSTVTRSLINKNFQSKSQSNEHSQSLEGTKTSQIRMEETVFPIPIREDVMVKIAGIPSDLSMQEAQKIANVITALATKDD